MEFGGIIENLKDKSILITGSTGFLGKIFVEKILRVQPHVKKLFLLIRAEDKESAMQRVESEVIGIELFNILKEEHGEGFQRFVSEKIFPLAGDVSCEHLGIHDTNLREKLWNDIDFIANIAATTKFYERYDIALAINTLGAKNVLDFAKRCKNLQILLHVSTAYVSGTRTSGLILEKPCRLGEALKRDLVLDIEEELRVVEKEKKGLQSKKLTKDAEKVAMRQLGLTRAKHFGWPNTYAFTKAMGEMLLGHMKGDLPLCIMRPTIITSIYHDPLPGWIEGTRTIDSFIIAYAKRQLPCMFGDFRLTIDLIPGDMVVNAMIVTMVARSTLKFDEFVYHIGSSARNPVTYSTLEKSMRQYLNKCSHDLKDERSLTIRKPLVIKSMTCFRAYMILQYGLPLKTLWLMNAVSGQSFTNKWKILNRKYKSAMFLSDLYKPYLLFNGIYDDNNLNKLKKDMKDKKDADAELFNFNPLHIKWDDYFTNIHIPGFLKYANK